MVQALLTAAIYLLGMYYIRNSTKDRYEEWDKNTTTISDYIVKYNIPSALYNTFIKEHHRDSDINSDRSDASAIFEKNSPIYAFKKYLKRQIEDKLKYIEPVMYKNPELIKISEITFVFENTPVINLMIKRGDALDVDNEEKAIRIEDKVKDYLRENSHKVSVPKEAYVTFKTEEAYLRGVQLDSTSICGRIVPKETWRGHPFVLEQVQEPSNIYWENRHTSKILKFIKQIIVTLILILILVFFIGILFYTQKLASKLRREYPEIDCNEVKGDLVGENMLKRFAMTEWFHWQENDGSEESVLKLTTSNLQCYCDDEVHNNGRSDTLKLIQKIDIGGKQKDGEICKDYLEADRILFFIYLIVPLLIIISNAVIKHASVLLCAWVGFDKRTNEISMIQILCFFILFFNNALAILLLNARFRHLMFINVFNGEHEDFDCSWYRDIAPFIISPMYIQIIFPIQNLIPDFSIQQGLAWLDRRFTNPKLYKTH